MDSTHSASTAACRGKEQRLQRHCSGQDTTGQLCTGCHSLVLEQHQRVIAFLGSPVRLTSNQAQGSMPAFTQRQPCRIWLLKQRDTDGKQGSHFNTVELPIHTGTGNITSGAQVKIWAWHSRNKRRKLAQWYNALSGTTLMAQRWRISSPSLSVVPNRLKAP